MSQSNRRSFYFNEENHDLFAFLKTKKRANEWVMNAIRQTMMTELNGGVVHPATPSQPQVDYQALMQRILLLESQAQQVKQIQPSPVENTSIMQPKQAEPVVATPAMPEPVLESIPTPELEPVAQPQPMPAVRPVVKNYQVNKPQPQVKTQPKQPVDPFDSLGSIGFN